MNPRRLLSLLGPRAPSLTRQMHREFGVGTRSGVTPQEVAAALGWIKHPLATEVYMLLWVPGYAERDGKLALLTTRLGAQLLLDWGHRIGLDDTDRGFPPLPPSWNKDPRGGCQAVARACLFELQQRHECEACLGYGAVPALVAGALQASQCARCKGRGVVAYPDKLRAQLVKLRYQTYKRHVGPAYTWLLETLRDLEQTAAQAHYEALRDPATR